MQPTLVVVDMQPEFEAAFHPNVVIGVTQEIINAKNVGAPIILVEYRDGGQTFDGFFKLLKNYKNKALVRKNRDDGSREVIQAIKRRKFNPYHLRVCGVNSDACVWSTVEGLLGKLNRSRIEVVKQACFTEDRTFDWRQFLRHKNLRLV